MEYGTVSNWHFVTAARKNELQPSARNFSAVRRQDNICASARQMLDIKPTFLYNNKALRGVAQMVACLVRDQEAVGSNPATPTNERPSFL